MRSAIIAALLAAALLSGCDGSSLFAGPPRESTPAERELARQRERAESDAAYLTSPQTWEMGIPLEQLPKAWATCRRLNTPCAQIPPALQTIADAVASCQRNGTDFCIALRTAIPASPLGRLLPPAKNPVELPTHPFYLGRLSTGNALIDALAVEKAHYRRDALALWWGHWWPLFAAAAASALAVMAGMGWAERRRRLRAAAAACQEQEQRRSQEQAAAARRAELERQKQADAARLAAARIEDERKEQARRAAEEAKRLKEAKEAAEAKRLKEAEEEKAKEEALAVTKSIVEAMQKSSLSSKNKKKKKG